MFKWHVDEIGSNYRLTEIQSAVGIIQLLNLKNTLKKRELNANKLITVCNKIDCLRVPPIPKNIKHAYYRFYVFLNQDKIKKPWNQKKIIEKINNMGVPCFSGSCPEIYRERAFIDRNLSPKKRLKNAETLGKTSIAFLIDHTISKIDIDEACIKIKKFLTKFKHDKHY